jgi:hypothetical protein
MIMLVMMGRQTNECMGTEADDPSLAMHARDWTAPLALALLATFPWQPWLGGRLRAAPFVTPGALPPCYEVCVCAVTHVTPGTVPPCYEVCEM